MLEQVISSVGSHIITQRRTEQDKFKIMTKRPKKLANIAFDDISPKVEPSPSCTPATPEPSPSGGRQKEVADIDAKLDVAAPQRHDLPRQPEHHIPESHAGRGEQIFCPKIRPHHSLPITNKDMKEIVRLAVIQAASENDFDTVDDVLRGDVLREAILHQMKMRPKKEKVRLTLDRAGRAKCARGRRTQERSDQERSGRRRCSPA